MLCSLSWLDFINHRSYLVRIFVPIIPRLVEDKSTRGMSHWGQKQRARGANKAEYRDFLPYPRDPGDIDYADVSTDIDCC